MIYDNMEFFNIRELTKEKNYNGLRMNRFPKNIINSFESQFPASYSRGCEIRFKIESGSVWLYLLAVDEDGEVIIFFGDYWCSRYILPKGVITPINITVPQLLKKDFDKLNTKWRFNKNICRVFCNSKSIMHYCGCDFNGNNIMPPNSNEKPMLTFLAYGSSITHGAIAIGNYNSYIQILARLLKAQVYNFGMSGSCRVEKEISDYIISEECDFYLLELGVNLRGSCSKEEFFQRASYLIENTALKKKPVFVITIYPNIHTYLQEEPLYSSEKEFNEALREIVANLRNENIHLIEGSDVLTNFSELTTDFIHPSDGGHIEMAYNLYKEIIKHIT